MTSGIYYLDEAFAYTGRLFDKATGLQNNLNRWYNPAIGRWMSEDPIGFNAGDVNLYRYVGNHPTTYSDPSGLFGSGWPIPGQNSSVIYVPQPTPKPTPRPAPAPPPNSFNPPAGCQVAGWRQPADVFIPGSIGDLRSGWGGENWGNIDLPVGSSVAPAIPFTYGLPRNSEITQCNCGAILDSMRKAAELMRNSGRLNELQDQMRAIETVEAECESRGWPKSNTQ